MQPITFGITSREFQCDFDVEKYVALACQQPRSILLQQLVEQEWVEWCDVVAVWGVGFDGWLMKTSLAANAPLYEVLRLQGLSNPKNVQNRTHLWDDKLYRGCGLHLPPEYGYLDRWLEPLWQQVCKQYEYGLKNSAQPLFTSAT